MKPALLALALLSGCASLHRWQAREEAWVAPCKRRCLLDMPDVRPFDLMVVRDGKGGQTCMCGENQLYMGASYYRGATSPSAPSIRWGRFKLTSAEVAQ